MGTMTIKGKTMRSVDVDWKEFYYTNCPLISVSNVDQELGWVKEELKMRARDLIYRMQDQIGVEYRYLRSTVENDWYPAFGNKKFYLKSNTYKYSIPPNSLPRVYQPRH